MNNFETIIGLETHIELKTKNKLFSNSKVSFGDPPNSNTNEIDWAYPGTLPVLNKEAIDFGILVANSLNASITKHMFWDRKNYMYPDNPRSYQITQFRNPIGKNGFVKINIDGQEKKIEIKELHLEDDAGKNTHGSDGHSYVDFNRQGTPLIEVVSSSNISSPEEAVEYLERLRKIIQFTGTSDVKMQEGSLRVDANISLRPYGQKEYGKRVEIKNINSFQYLKKALEYEQNRQLKIILSGNEVVTETRRFDSKDNITISMRGKENAQDYRYFPEPDLPGILIDEHWLENIISNKEESLEERIEKYENLSFSEKDIDLLLQDLSFSNFFNSSLELSNDPKTLLNIFKSLVSRYLNDEKKDIYKTKLTPENISKLSNLVSEGVISSKQNKIVFKEVLLGNDPKVFVEENNLSQESRVEILRPIISEIVDNNSSSVTDYHNGKDRALGFLVGQIMKATSGNANPKVINEILISELDKRK